jgi:hypothetical protein
MAFDFCSLLQFRESKPTFFAAERPNPGLGNGCRPVSGTDRIHVAQ